MRSVRFISKQNTVHRGDCSVSTALCASGKAGGEYRFEYEDIDQVFDFDFPDEQRPANQTILVERNGQPVRQIYNKFGNLLGFSLQYVQGSL